MVFEEGKHNLKYEYENTQFMVTPSLQKVRHGHETLQYNSETQAYIEVRFA